MITEEYDVVELTLEDGSKMLQHGGDAFVYKAWHTWPVVSARKTGEKGILQYICIDESDETIYQGMQAST